MHYFQFNIGDYMKHTARLTLMEDLAYRRMLDLYYLNDGPLCSDIKRLSRQIGMAGEEDAIAFVLSEFFTLDGDAYRNNRADKEISSYAEKAEKSRLNGRKGGRPRTCQQPSDNPEETQQVIFDNPEESERKGNHKPLTINQEPINKTEEDSMSSELDDGVSAVIEKINSITGKKLMASTKAHRENISARLRDGHSVQELISVVEVKAAEWMGTKYEAYLVPSTLFIPKNFSRYLSESSIAARTMTAEDVVQAYHDELPEMPSVDYITRELRASITEFCLKSGFNAAKLKKYFDYIRSSCGWVMDERYNKDFRFLINLETLNRAVNGTLSNRSE